MSKANVTGVSRNNADRIAEWAATAAFLYYVTHPDMVEELQDRARVVWRHVKHRLSIWVAVQDIRSLPEVDD